MTRAALLISIAAIASSTGGLRSARLVAAAEADVPDAGARAADDKPPTRAERRRAARAHSRLLECEAGCGGVWLKCRDAHKAAFDRCTHGLDPEQDEGYTRCGLEAYGACEDDKDRCGEQCARAAAP